jgi:hypothetical protein
MVAIRASAFAHEIISPVAEISEIPKRDRELVAAPVGIPLQGYVGKPNRVFGLFFSVLAWVAETTFGCLFIRATFCFAVF